MIKKFWEYGKFKEYFVWAFENRFALIGTVLLVIATYYLKIYEDLQNYISILDSTFGVIIGALIGTLALIFSGIVFGEVYSIKNLEKRLLNIRKMKRLLISCI